MAPRNWQDYMSQDSITNLPYRSDSRSSLQPTLHIMSDDVRDAVQKTLKNVDKTAMLEEFFLERLSFKTIDDREEEITAAHKATFEWIFDAEVASPESAPAFKAEHSFTDWLAGKHDSPVYWIHGKPGSGKSTLMRYIHEHSKTPELLKSWDSDKPVLYARFFFWTSGTVEQKSQAGFLRSLLHQLLRQKKEAIPWTFPDMWLKYQDTKARVAASIQWSTDKLISALQTFLQRVTGQVRICFFIDGLDEIEESQQALVQLVQNIVRIGPQDFKACVSSRPWKIFEESFANVPQLRLQDLTRADIRRFVEDRLTGSPKIQRILQKEADLAEELKEKAVKNADGVFLWASLGVRTLFERTKPEHTVSDLLQTLETLPTDLNDLFRHLLFESKSAEERKEQSRILQIVRAREIVCDFTQDESSNSVTLYQLGLADRGKEIQIVDEPELPEDDEIRELCQETEDHLNSRCSGLLQVHRHEERGSRAGVDAAAVRFGIPNYESGQLLARGRVGYLHRTVRDFLLFSGGFESAAKNFENNFDPHICLLRSHILQLKLPLEEPEKHRRLDEWWSDIVLAMTHARYINPESISLQTELLNMFKSTLDWYWATRKSDPLDNWARNAFASYEERMKFQTPYHYPFLSLATKFGIRQYLETELSTEKYPYKGGIPLLSYAVEFLADRRKTVYPLSSPQLVEMLLRNNQDPNLVYKTLRNQEETPWLLTLKHVREADRRCWIQPYSDNQSIKRWVQVLESFLQHGADPNAMIVKDQWDPAATALDVITMVRDNYNSSTDLERLHDSLVRRGATRHAEKSEF